MQEDYTGKVANIGKLSPAAQLRETLKLEDYLASIYKNGYDAGFKIGKASAIDILKNKSLSYPKTIKALRLTTTKLLKVFGYMRNRNVLIRIAIVQEIMNRHYEQGNQSKSQVQVLRNILMKQYPMSERTLRRYMKTDVDKERDNLLNGQLELNFENVNKYKRIEYGNIIEEIREQIEDSKRCAGALSTPQAIH